MVGIGGRSAELPYPLQIRHLLVPLHIHEPGSSPNHVVQGFLWRLHYAGIVD